MTLRTTCIALLFTAVLLTVNIAVAQSALIADAVAQVSQYDVYEITFDWSSAMYENPWMAVDLNLELTAPSGAVAAIDGFYYDTDVWKARYAPAEIGMYTWNAALTDASGTFSANGEFDVIASDAPGFLRISDDNPMRWEFENGAAFHPVGIQDCLLDVNNDGNPINDWGLDGDFRAPGQHLPGEFADIDTYFSTYAAAGFNLFRWSPNNCSFDLYERVAPSANRYDILAGIWGDQLVQAARTHGFRVYMGIFGFQPPHLHDPRPGRMEAIRRAVDYIVARYGAYVDVWELMNEARPDVGVPDTWYEVAATRFAEIDPYQHPISTSWERPDLPYIDIMSPHWYASEPPTESAAQTLLQIVTIRTQAEAVAPPRPIMFGEVGNVEVNWDAQSADRLRVRAWTAFFNEASLIFWNSSFAKDYRVDRGAANVYLGEEERAYVRVLHDYAAAFPADTFLAAPRIVAGDISAYALSAPERVGVYVVSQTSFDAPTPGAQIELNVPFAGSAVWIDPRTGAELARFDIQAGVQVLDVPSFIGDAALSVMP
jgi:hypothetical protein